MSIETAERASEMPAEQFVSLEQQRQAATFGMWIFLATEVLFFGGLLLLYTVYRIWYPHDFAAASRHLDFLLGTINTAILLTSSFFMAGAVTAGHLLERRTAIVLLLLTAACGTVFLAIKAYEWHAAIQGGFWPGTHWLVITDQPPGVKLFYALYFALTGLHGIHLIIGITLILGTTVKIRNQSLATHQNFLNGLGLYWHFVDIVWIFLYPLLYFIGRSVS